MSINYKYILTIVISTVISTAILINCSGGEMPDKKVAFRSIKDIPASSWEKLSQKKIYFGHQSVGFNIMAGVQDVMNEHPEIKLNIVETSDASDFNVGLFAHSRVGKNVDPKSKIDEFVNFMDKGIGKKADFAVLKFCYVDMRPDTDVKKIFIDYTKSISQLKENYPEMTIIHFTVPLTQNQTGPKAWIKKIIGRPVWGVEGNIKRNEYNEILLKKYKGKEPIFDIAAIESTFPDGTRSTFTKNGKKYYLMVPEYTDDGGHLNEIGRKKVAEQLLILLANLIQ